ncbi:hypothetical protein [Clostridium tertium]|uniref:hypothetical protein n=1 Tax=Clostridium tertium TaxID=1559 RepID=UPI00374F4CDE
MRTKVKILISSNFIFYFLVLFHTVVVNIYGDDYILQAAIYIALSFSTVVIEEVFRKKINELKIISVIDFISRVVTLLIHFLWVYFYFNIYIVSFISIILFTLNILIEIYLIKISKNFNESKVEIIDDKEIKDFINKFYNNELDTSKCGLKLKSEIKDIIDTIELSGKLNLVCIFLFIGIFISRFLYKNISSLMLFDFILICSLLYIFVNINSNLIVRSLEKDKKIKVILENISFVIGYILLFVCEVILQGKIDNIRVSIWVLVIITFIPLFNRKYKIKEKLKIVYKEYMDILD